MNDKEQMGAHSMETQESVCEGAPRTSVPFREALRVWVKVALNSFGGPAGQIAVMHRYLVEEKRWISESRFLHALNYCMLLPGPEAQQLATYIGWLLHKTAGGVVAGSLFVLPGFISILVLSILYAGFQDLSVVQWLFFGLKPAALAVVIDAVLRIGRRALTTRVMVAVAALAFVAIFFGHVPFPAIVLSASLFGYIGSRLRPDWFPVTRAHAHESTDCDVPVVDAILDEPGLNHTHPSLGRSFRVAAIWSVLWFAPIAAILLFMGSENVYFQEAVFFSKSAVVTFGGAYAVLAYVAQQAVETYGWLKPGEMLDGLGLAETTPGPLIMVLEFVGFLGAYRNAGAVHPLIAGTLGATLTTWVTFTPCFLWIFLGAPYIEALRGNRSLKAAMSAITAAVVGVILNLGVWFALHTSFGSLQDVGAAGFHLGIPVWHTVNIPSVVIAAFALFVIFRLKWSMIRTLGVSAGLGMLYHLVRWLFR